MKHKTMLSEICNVLNLYYIGFEQEIRSFNFCNRFSKCNHILSHATIRNYIEKTIRRDRLQNHSQSRTVKNKPCFFTL